MAHHQVAKPLHKAMLSRAAVVLRKKKPVVEQWFREMSPELMARIEEVHEHAVHSFGGYVDSAMKRFASALDLPDRIQAGDCTREASSVFCSKKNAGRLGATRTADRFTVTIGSFASTSLDSFASNLALALRAIADIRTGSNTTLLAAFESADRARIEQKLGYVELQAGQGRAYTKYLAELNGLRIDRFPDLLARLNTALSLASKPADERQAERWIGFVESAAEKGYLCEKGIEEVERLNLGTWPALEARYTAAIALATRATALKWVAYVEDSAQKGYLYVGGVEALGLMDLEPFPDVKERLDAAVARAARSEADQEPDGKTLVPAGAPPATAELWEVPGGDSIVSVQRLGLAYPITERSAQTQGPALMEHIGELGQLAYWRHATSAELEAFFCAPPAPTERNRG